MMQRRARAVKTALLLATLLGPSGSAAAPGGAPPCPGQPAGGVPVRNLGAQKPQLLLDANFPDPFVARFGKNYYAYATGTQLGQGRANVQLVRSRTLANWTTPVEVLPRANLPAWVDRNHPQVWAPEVVRVGGRFLLFFNARHHRLTRTETPPEGPRVLQRHCLGVATANTPDGPFVGAAAPLVCAAFKDGVIDAGVFQDGDRLFLFYKDDGNCCGRGTAIFAQELRADGLGTRGPPRRLLANNDSPTPNDDWEWLVVEAPTMVKRGNSYVLFYSGNYFGNKNYSVGYLTCRTPLGPCRDAGDNPILWSHAKSPLVGPGHQSLLDIGDRSYAFFHAWNRDPDGRERPGVHKRCLYVSQVRWDRAPITGDPRPRIVGGTPGPQ